MNIYSENYKVKRIKSLIDQAQAINGEVAAKKVLFEAMVSLSHVIDGHEISKAQIQSLKFVHDSLKEFLLEDTSLEIAFCVDKSTGRPRSDVYGEDVFYILKIDDEVTNQYRSTGKPNVVKSLKHVANQLSMTDSEVSARRLKQAWDSLGSLKGYKLRKESS